MGRLLLISVNHTRTVITLLVLLTGIALYFLPGLRLEITAEGMMVKNDPARLFYERTLDAFGSDNVTIVYLEDDNLFDSRKLELIQRAVNEINKLVLVEKTDSLFSIRYLRTIDGFTYTSPYLASIPQNSEQANAIKQAALINPLIKKNLLSEDGRVMAINVHFDAKRYFRGFDKEVSSQLEQILQPLKAELGRVFFIGDPYVRNGISQRIHADQQMILPGAILLLVITLAISLRRLQAALIPLLTAGLSVIWILGLMAALDIPVNVMSSVIPALLIIIGSTEDIHLLSEYLNNYRQGVTRDQAIQLMSDNMGMAIMLTFVTTYVGFLSIALNDLELIKQFGLLTSTGLLLNFLITVLLVPASLKLGGRLSSAQKTMHRDHLYARVARLLLIMTDKYRYQVMAVLILSVLLGLYNALDLRINNNVMDYFDDDSTIIQQSRQLHQNLSGIQSLSLVLRGTPGTFLQVPYIRNLASIQQHLDNMGYFDNSFSFADFIGVVHSGLDGERPGVIYLPAENEVVEGYMAFLDNTMARDFVSTDYSQAKIIVRHNISNSEKLNRVVDAIYQYVNKNVESGIDFQVTGESYLNSRAIDYMARGQAQSLILMILVIFILMSILFVNSRAGVVAVIANLFPIIILFGVMGFFGIPLNTGTAMVATISLGICVDHSMHFMVRYQRLSKNTDSRFDALDHTVRLESLPIMATALSLAVGFAALTLSDFPPVAKFGQLSALVMLLALISTFIIIPLLLRYIRLTSVWDMLSLDLKRDVVKTSPLFAGMSNWQARKIVALSEIIDYRQDEAILMQDDPVDHLFLLLSGSVEVWRREIDGSTYMLDSIEPGGVFGAMSPLEQKQCHADMVAIIPSTIMRLRAESIHTIGRVSPRLAVKLLENLNKIANNLINLSTSTRTPFRDQRTGAFNATLFLELLNHNIDWANRYDKPLSMIVIDIDGLPRETRLNDDTQYQKAQDVIADIILRNIRKPDIFGLWPDGSYWIALTNTNSSGAEAIGGRLNLQLTQHSLNQQPHRRITLIKTELNDGEFIDSFIMRINNLRESALGKSTVKLEYLETLKISG